MPLRPVSVDCGTGEAWFSTGGPAQWRSLAMASTRELMFDSVLTWAPMKRLSLIRWIPLSLAGLLCLNLTAQPRFNEELLNGLKYRNIGPFRAGGWTTDIAVPETPQAAHLYTYYVGTRNGGVFKT